jgi:hypothetical protein
VCVAVAGVARQCQRTQRKGAESFLCGVVGILVDAVRYSKSKSPTMTPARIAST